MGEARLVGETGPDAAGKNLSPTTVKVSSFDIFIPCYFERRLEFNLFYAHHILDLT